MKIVKFIVEGGTIKKDPSSNTLHSGDTDVQAEFVFSSEWDGMAKVAKFMRGDTEFEPQIQMHGVACGIPDKALTGNFLRISVLGKRKGMSMKTSNSAFIEL